jgi:tetratricopeptide (TPR) repeat protein
MDFDIIPQVVIIFFTGIIVLVLAKNISKVKETPDDFLFESENVKKEREKFIYLYKRLTRRINKEKYQEKVDLFWVWFEKVLRKLRINFLRLDNKIVSALDKVKEKNVESETETKTETKSEDQWREYDKPRDENMYMKDEEVEKIETESKSDEDVVKTDELNAGNKKGKEKEYIDLILKNPIDIKSYWKLGIVYSRKKNYKDAISCFRQIIKIDPTYTKAKKKITDLMERMKKKNDSSS